MTKKWLWTLAACVGGMCVMPSHAMINERLFSNSFDIPADLPANDGEAARFLTQATFGPTPAEIARLRQIGYSQWIREQLNIPATLVRPYMEQVNAALVAANQGGVSHNQRLDRWFHTALYAPDQLRQRMAFALSQIVVISDQNGTLGGEPIQVSHYWDLLALFGLDSYRNVLQGVTLNPSMGKYLSHFRNRKASSDGTRQPDENYAREVMQLFTIGLVERNLDFSPILIGGQPVPTYDQDDISALAKVFTGFNYNNATSISNGTNNYLPMTCIQAEHDVTAKTLFTPPIPIAAGQACLNEVSYVLDVLSLHPNVAPFIARQLIQRFTSSTPSAAYIQRVAQKYNDNGQGERADLGAVIMQILLDPEARGAPGPNSGKPREPLLKLTAMWRAWGAQSPAADVYGNIPMGMTNPTGTYGQRPLGADSVFNFYQPDYSQPGAVADAGLYSPEFQILNESTVTSTANSLWTYSFNSWIGMTSPPTNRPLLDLAPLTGLGTGNAAYAAMVEEANRRMLYGTMSSTMRDALYNAVRLMDGNVSTSERARSIIYLVAISPEYAIQR